jgi:hypothetical protein
MIKFDSECARQQLRLWLEEEEEEEYRRNEVKKNDILTIF